MYANPYSLPDHQMNLLILGNSWKLLCDEAFGQKHDFPPELKKVGKKIVEKSQGLPLMISVIAGHLSKMARALHIWKDFAGSLAEIIASHPEKCFGVLEGFIRTPGSGKSSKEVAVDFLTDIIHRNLIMVRERRFNERRSAACFNFCGKLIGSSPVKLEVLSRFNLLRSSNKKFAVSGEVWRLSDEDKFGCLKLLLFSELYFECWEATCDNFPNLKRLVLKKCNHLKEIPTDFGEICTLESIELHNCCTAAGDSARNILNTNKLMWEIIALRNELVQTSMHVSPICDLAHSFVSSNSLAIKSRYKLSITLDELRSSQHLKENSL
ncbi:hypothetical protein BC332_13065 [Capsicum chinense]|nr:hypothetical protein BC332_13065 [Capsicum chinense]